MNTRIRTLEVAALPFPSRQGTQAFLREQCEALAEKGHEVHLLVYAHGGFEYDAPFTIHRLKDWPRERSLRSGPSLNKVALDLQLAYKVRKLSKQLRPHIVHAHNYEALVACLLARPCAPVVFHAHTLFAYELPTFARNFVSHRLAKWAGEFADRFFPPRAAFTVAVSPRLVEELAKRGHPRAHLDFSAPGFGFRHDFPSESERNAVRKEFGLENKEVIGYCGNLDGYQGLNTLVSAVKILSRSRPNLRLLMITTSDPTSFREQVEAHNLGDRLVLCDHGDFGNALRKLSAADVCVVPRSAPGGFPIKLLSYLAAGKPCVATHSGTGGIDFGRSVLVVPDGDPEAFAESVAWLLDRPDEALARGHSGSEQLSNGRFDWDRAVEAFERRVSKIADSKLR